jgi:hypothetical protein
MHTKCSHSSYHRLSRDFQPNCNSPLEVRTHATRNTSDFPLGYCDHNILWATLVIAALLERDPTNRYPPNRLVIELLWLGGALLCNLRMPIPTPIGVPKSQPLEPFQLYTRCSKSRLRNSAWEINHEKLQDCFKWCNHDWIRFLKSEWALETISTDLGLG